MQNRPAIISHNAARGRRADARPRPLAGVAGTRTGRTPRVGGSPPIGSRCVSTAWNTPSAGSDSASVSTHAIERYAGHLGLRGVPAFRGNRLAERSCRLILPLARRHGFHELWITCNPDNWPSRRTCERLGAELIDTVDVPRDSDVFAPGSERKCATFSPMNEPRNLTSGDTTFDPDHRAPSPAGRERQGLRDLCARSQRVCGELESGAQRFKGYTASEIIGSTFPCSTHPRISRRASRRSSSRSRRTSDVSRMRGGGSGRTARSSGRTS